LDEGVKLTLVLMAIMKNGYLFWLEGKMLYLSVGVCRHIDDHPHADHKIKPNCFRQLTPTCLGVDILTE